MKSSTNYIRLLHLLLMVLLVFLAMNAIGGGFLLVFDPSGATLGIPVGLLADTPFSNYLIPGLILILANGVLSIVTVVYSMRKKRKY